jgi:hypothetical protein
MSAAFTPGPWHIVPHGDGDSLVICDDEEAMWRICFMATPGSAGSFEKITANARLIAAAPELYEALCSLVDQDLEFNGESIVIRCGSHGQAIERSRKARTALAKARGDA